MALQEKKCLQNAQTNHLFQSISCSKAMLWNFHCIKCLDKHVEQDDGRKSRDPQAEFQERIRKIEHALSVEEVFVASDWTACPYLKVVGLTRKIQSSSKLQQVRK